MKLTILATAGIIAFAADSCSPADTASRNISVAAEHFEIQRRAVFYNGITGDYILEIEGRCSYETAAVIDITCRTGPDDYVRHTLGRSDNVTFFVEQLEGVDVSEYHNRIVWRPQTILPAIELDVSGEALIEAVPTLHE